MSLLAILIASLLGSLHCIGMCGGFAAACSVHGGNALRAQISYNLGRLLTYISLGLFAGMLGHNLDQIGLNFGISRLAAILLGSLLVLSGISQLLSWSTARRIQALAASLLGRVYQRASAAFQAQTASARAFTTGLLSTLLPCGWLYAYVAVAAASGSALGGLATMVVFWIGTVPALFIFGRSAGFLAKKMGAVLPRITALLLIAAGLFAIAGHQLHVHHQHHH